MENLNENPIKHLAFTSLLIIALAFFNMPYGFYTFLRIFLFITSIFYLYNTSKDKTFFLLSWLICAIVYNPIIPLEFKRDEWLPVNVCTMVYILFWLWNNTTSQEKEYIQNEGAVWIAIILTTYLIALLG